MQNQEPLVFVERSVIDTEGPATVGVIIGESLRLSRKHKPLDVYIRPTGSRKGDFTAILTEHKPTPHVLALIAIPGGHRSPIVQELYKKE